MDRSQTRPCALLPEHSALQHERAPRPLPLFLELVREVSRARSGAGARRARRVCAPTRPRRGASAPPPKPEIARVGGACLRDHGGDGPPAVLVPSLINPPRHPRSRRAGVADRARSRGWAGARCCSTGARPTSASEPRRRGPCRRIAAAVAAQHRRAGGARSAIASAGRWRSPPPTWSPVRARRDPRRAVEFLALSGRVAARAAGHVAPFASRPRERSARCRWKCCRRPSGRSIPSARSQVRRVRPARSGKRRGAALRRARGMGERGRAPALSRGAGS